MPREREQPRDAVAVGAVAGRRDGDGAGRVGGDHLHLDALLRRRARRRRRRRPAARISASASPYQAGASQRLTKPGPAISARSTSGSALAWATSSSAIARGGLLARAGEPQRDVGRVVAVRGVAGPLERDVGPAQPRRARPRAARSPQRASISRSRRHAVIVGMWTRTAPARSASSTSRSTRSISPALRELRQRLVLRLRVHAHVRPHRPRGRGGRHPRRRRRAREHVDEVRQGAARRDERLLVEVRDRAGDPEPARSTRPARTSVASCAERCGLPSSRTSTRICTRSRRCSPRSTRAASTSSGASATSSATGRGRTSASPLLRERAAVCLGGNHDLVVARQDPARHVRGRGRRRRRRGRAASSTRPRAAFSTRWSRRRPLPGAELFHGSPRDPVWDYVLSEDAARWTPRRRPRRRSCSSGTATSRSSSPATATELRGGQAAGRNDARPRRRAAAAQPRLGRPAARRRSACRLARD